MTGIEARHDIPHPERPADRQVSTGAVGSGIEPGCGQVRDSGTCRKQDTTRAILNLEKADRWRRSGGTTGRAVAGILESEAHAALKPRADLQVSCGEVLPDDGDPNEITAWTLKNTLARPDMVAAHASEARTSRVAELDIAALAVDAAQTIDARNSIEKMLAHQLAAAHDAAMQLLKRALDPKNPPVEMARLANCSARLMDAFQQGLLALHRVRSGGKQVIRVERLVVSNGAQAVVGNFERGAERGPGRHQAGKERSDGRP